MLSSVVLPLPLGPISTTNDPRPICISRPRSALTLRSFMLNVRSTAVMLMIGLGLLSIIFIVGSTIPWDHRFHGINVVGAKHSPATRNRYSSMGANASPLRYTTMATPRDDCDDHGVPNDFNI